jgi:tetratricopeptide (TPR) repeat protein
MTTIESIELALTHQRAGRLKEAERLCRAALHDDADHPDALHLLGVVLFQAGDCTESANLMRRVISLHPDEAQLHGHLGSVLAAQGKLDEALASFERGMALDPELAELPHNLGNALHRAGRSQDAAMAFLKALSIRSGYTTARNNLTTLLRQLATEDAIGHWRQRLENRAGLKVGLAWRPIPLSAFLPLFRISEVTYFSFDESESERPEPSPTGLNLVDWSDELVEFRESISLIAALDCLVTADLPIAQFASLLGRPVLALLEADEEEQPWIGDGHESRIRLFRRQPDGDWALAINQIARVLADAAVAAKTEAPCNDNRSDDKGRR